MSLPCSSECSQNLALMIITLKVATIQPRLCVEWAAIHGKGYAQETSSHMSLHTLVLIMGFVAALTVMKSIIHSTILKLPTSECTAMAGKVSAPLKRQEGGTCVQQAISEFWHSSESNTGSSSFL